MQKIIEEILHHPEFKEGSCWEKLQYNANQNILNLGDPPQGIFYIKKGSVRILGNITIEETRHIQPGISELSDGALFGEMSLFDGGNISASVTAISDCELVRIQGEELLQFMETHSDLGYRFLSAIMGVMVSRLRKSNQQFQAVMAWGLKAHGLSEHL